MLAPEMHAMPQLIAALFETRDQAEQALTALVGAGTAPERIQIIGDGPEGGGAGLSQVREDSSGSACAAALRGLRLPDEDASAFAAACGGGGAVLAATVDEAELDDAVQVIETFDPIDLDSRTEHRIAEHGAAGADAGSPLAAAGGPLAAGFSAGGLGGQTNTGALPGMGAMTDGTDDLGSGDLRTQDVTVSDMGLSSTTATGARRDDERAGAPGALELGASADARTVAEQPSSAERTAGVGQNAKPDLFRREANRVGRVRAYVSG